VLSLLDAEPHLTAKAIARRTGIPKSSVHNLLNILREWGFASYSLSSRTWSLGDWVNPSHSGASSVREGLEVLEQFDRRRVSLTVDQLHAMTGISEARLDCAVADLEDAGYLTCSAGRYSLGLGVVRIASRVERIERLRETARPFLFYLRDQTDETSNLLIEDRDSAFYVEQIDSTRLLRISGWAGRSIPLEGTASGAALRSQGGVHVLSSPEDEVTAVVTRVPRVPDPPTAVSVTAPTSRATPERIALWRVAVAEAAQGLSRSLNGTRETGG
jgi:urocanate hydratase